MAISQRFLDELIARTDIVDLVGQYVQLSRKGANYFGLCPFHNEKTGSFSVNAERQIYHCFGCGAGGGAIRFVMEIESLPFPEAVAFLARRAGMEMEEEAETDLSERRRRTQLLELNKKAAKFFYQRFLSSEGEIARNYALRRGINADTIKKFGIGYAPDAWSSLLDFFKNEGASEAELLDAGLILRGKKGRCYDRFRNRLMFPIINIRGEVIAFGGRILGDGEPKYLNSPDSLLFNKGRNLFALNLAKSTKTGQLILTEGNMDAVSLHQAGFTNAVASCGTALTEEQAKLMSRFAKEIIIAYDSDSAGRKAVLRAISILEKTGLSVRVLNYKGAKDPDEFIQKNGAESFALLLDQSGNHIAYRLDAIKQKYDLSKDTEKIAYLREAAEMLCKLSSIEKEIYCAKVADSAGITQGAMMAAVQEALRKNKKKSYSTVMRQEAAPIQRFQPQERELHYLNPASAKAEEELIRLMIEDETLLPKVKDKIQPEEFSSDFLRKVFSCLLQQYAEHDLISAGALETRLTGDEMNRLTLILQRPGGTVADGVVQMDSYIDVIKRQAAVQAAKGTDEDLLSLQKKLAQKQGAHGTLWREKNE